MYSFEVGTTFLYLILFRLMLQRVNPSQNQILSEHFISATLHFGSKNRRLDTYNAESPHLDNILSHQPQNFTVHILNIHFNVILYLLGLTSGLLPVGFKIEI